MCGPKPHYLHSKGLPTSADPSHTPTQALAIFMPYYGVFFGVGIYIFSPLLNLPIPSFFIASLHPPATKKSVARSKTSPIGRHTSPLGSRPSPLVLATAANFPGRERVGTILILLPISPQNLYPYLTTRGTLGDDSPRGLGGGISAHGEVYASFLHPRRVGGGGRRYTILSPPKDPLGQRPPSRRRGKG